MSVLACNLASYGAHRASAYPHLAEIGVRFVELACPEPNGVATLQGELGQYGLSASTLTIPCQMDADDVVIRFAHYLDAAQEMGVQIVFTSAKTCELNREYVYGRLQNIGDEAEKRGIVVALETHPDLVTNGRQGLETMQGVAHPNVRVNFDTANVYYYNRDVTAEDELAHVVDYVASVHLKDTDGGYESWHFPALGEGVVNFAACLDRLKDVGYDGPYTLELEGIQGENFTEDLAKGRVEASVAYLKEIGLLAS